MDAVSSEMIAKAEEFKNLGNELFKQGNFKGALGLKGVDKTSGPSIKDMYGAASIPAEKLESVQTLRHTAWQNMAVCHAKQNNPKRTIECASEALLIKNTVKALFLRGQAYLATSEIDKAQQDLEAAHKLEPKNGAIMDELKKLNAALKQIELKEKAAYQKMFR